MAAAKIGQITQADVYLDDKSMVGRFREFTTPDLEWQEVEHETLGQIAVLSLPGRPLKKLTGKMTIEYLDSDLYPRLYLPNVFLPFALHSYVDIFNSVGVDKDNSYRVVTSVTIAIRKVGGRAFKLGDRFEGECEWSAQRFVQGVPGQTPWVELDVINQVNRVNGVDVWSQY